MLRIARQRAALPVARTARHLDAHDAGPLTMARYTEPFAMLWIQRAVVQRRGTGFAFALLER